MLHELMMPLYRVLRLVTLPLLQQPGPDLPQILSGPGRKAKQSVSDNVMLAKELPNAPQLAHPMAGQPIISARNERDVESLPTQQEMWSSVLSQQILAELALTELLPTKAFRNNEDQPENYRKGATNRNIEDGALWLLPIPDLAEAAHDGIELQQYPLSAESDWPPQMAQTKWPEMIKYVETDVLSTIAENVGTSSLQLPEMQSLSIPLQLAKMDGDVLLPGLKSSTNDKQVVRQLTKFANSVVHMKRTEDTYIEKQQGRVQETNPMAYTTPTHLTVHVHNRDTGTPNVRQQIEEVLLEIFDTMNNQ